MSLKKALLKLKQQEKLSVKREVKKAAAKLKKDSLKKSCIICGKKAEYCMRGIHNNTYCKKCAVSYFKFLNYLEKLS